MASTDRIIDVDMSSDHSDDELPTVAEMVADIMDGATSSTTFVVSTPAQIEKQTKAKQHGNDTKRKLDQDSKPAAMKGGKAKKKKKLDADPEITYYIFIPKPAVPTQMKARRGAKAAALEEIQRGPFSLSISEPYEALLSSIATELPCRIADINESQILWKPKKPKNAEKLRLAKEKGYKAMIMELEGKTVDNLVVLLYMPPPNKPMEDAPPWDTPDDSEPSFDFSELETMNASDSIEQQKVSSIYYSVGDRPKELQMKIPLPKFFDANQRIKTIPSAPAPTISAQTPATVSVLASATPPAPFSAGASSLSLADLLLANLLSNGGGGGLLQGLFPTVPSPLPAIPPTPAVPPAHGRSAPPSPIKRHKVTTDEFCRAYGLDDDDASLLKETGFRPGDRTEATLDDELKKIGFTFFSWKRIHNANLRFKADLAAGLHD
ncbi:hypothetical protein C8R45DRAFT_1206632 [Mycena sanguinolenta]|nr:hypothetical protein C8R45DRAFT_1206632 [Mycena sanguinolenta]